MKETKQFKELGGYQVSTMGLLDCARNTSTNCFVRPSALHYSLKVYDSKGATGCSLNIVFSLEML